MRAMETFKRLGVVELSMNFDHHEGDTYVMDVRHAGLVESFLSLPWPQGFPARYGLPLKASSTMRDFVREFGYAILTHLDDEGDLNQWDGSCRIIPGAELIEVTLEHRVDADEPKRIERLAEVSSKARKFKEHRFITYEDTFAEDGVPE